MSARVKQGSIRQLGQVAHLRSVANGKSWKITMVSHDVTNLTISKQFLNPFCVLNFASVNNDLLVTNLVTFMKKGY